MRGQGSYTTAHGRQRLKDIAFQMENNLRSCRICAHGCGVNRTLLNNAEAGICRVGEKALVSTAYPHFGEELILKGTKGSGTVFFSRCNMGCLYCQNGDISAKDAMGREVNREELARLYLDLQSKGVHNLNWVSPSHVVPQALEALSLAAENGLTLPVVYNTGGYDNFETIRNLDGIVDIYLPDIKTMDERHARTVLRSPSYPEIVLMALEEMIRQVGLTWELQSNGTLRRGLLVRHLVLPGGDQDSHSVLKTLLEEFGPDLPLHIMGQYVPSGKSQGHSSLGHPLAPQTYLTVLQTARAMGFKQLVGVKSAA